MKRALFLVLLLSACTGERQFVGECKTPADCPTGSTCKLGGADNLGVCVCRSDEACAEGEVCNSQGICQLRAGCRSNVDCESTKFCDIGSGDCIDRTRCGTDVHCLPGSVCDPAQGTCVSGCIDDADCPLYQICDHPGGVARGRCLAGMCDDKTFCEYGARCSGNACVDANNPSYCADCGQTMPCPTRSDFCLINSAYEPSAVATKGGPNFCAPTCAPQGDDCPNGYQCVGIILLTQDQCTNTGECGGGGRECAIGEGDLRGFCTCVNDQDCDFGPATCLGSCGGLGITPCTDNSQCLTTCEKLCQNSGRPCGIDADCAIPCQGGGCALGAACAPIQGLYCPDVR